jgi:hypothetical protein
MVFTFAVGSIESQKIERSLFFMPQSGIGVNPLYMGFLTPYLKQLFG